MTDLLPSTAETPTVPTLDMPVVRASHRRYGPARPVLTPARARRGDRRGRWTPVIVLLVVDWMVAMFLVGTVLFPDPVPTDRDSAPRSSVPSSVAVPPATVVGEPVAARVPRQGRQGGSPDGGASRPEASTSTTEFAPPVVPDAAPTRGQTSTKGPAGGPASTTTTAVPSTLPPTGPETTPPTAPPDSTPPATEPVPDTTPSTIPEETIP